MEVVTATKRNEGSEKKRRGEKRARRGEGKGWRRRLCPGIEGGDFVLRENSNPDLWPCMARLETGRGEEGRMGVNWAPGIRAMSFNRIRWRRFLYLHTARRCAYLHACWVSAWCVLQVLSRRISRWQPQLTTKLSSTTSASGYVETKAFHDIIELSCCDELSLFGKVLLPSM